MCAEVLLFPRVPALASRVPVSTFNDDSPDCSANPAALSSLILRFSARKSPLQANLDNPSPPSPPSVRHEIGDDKCSDFNPNLMQDYKPVAHL